MDRRSPQKTRASGGARWRKTDAQPAASNDPAFTLVKIHRRADEEMQRGAPSADARRTAPAHTDLAVSEPTRPGWVKTPAASACPPISVKVYSDTVGWSTELSPEPEPADAASPSGWTARYGRVLDGQASRTVLGVRSAVASGDGPRGRRHQTGLAREMARPEVVGLNQQTLDCGAGTRILSDPTTIQRKSRCHSRAPL
jgi:hypothetical protein